MRCRRPAERAAAKTPPVPELLHDPGDRKAACYADQPAHGANHKRLGDELQQDVDRTRAGCHANSDLTNALGHRDQA